MSRILVTGASGNVGAYVVQYALQHGDQVTAAGTRKEVLRTMFPSEVHCVSFDFTKPETFDAALQDVDRIYIMRPPHLGKPTDMQPFIDAIKAKQGIQLVCFLSLLGIEHNPIPPHYKIEKYIEAAGIPYCHIRPSFFMQNISGVHAFEIKHFNRIVVPVKHALTSFIDAQDIGELIAHILHEPTKHINTGYSITGSEAIDYWEVARIMSEELGREITYANPKPKLAKSYWINVRGLDKEYSTVMGMLYMMTRMGTAKKITSTYGEIMGKQPQTFQEFVKKNIEAWRIP